MRYLTITEICHLQNVKRWHMVATAKEQSVADHSFVVAALVHQMAYRCKIDPNKAAMQALVHDIDEVLTGDISPTAKQFSKNRGLDLSSIVNVAVPAITPKIRWDVALMIKAADLAEAVNFIGLWGVGNHAHQVELELRLQLNQLLKDIEDTDDLLHKSINSVIIEFQQGEYKIWDDGYETGI